MGRRKDSIRALIGRGDADIKKIENEYRNSLQAQQIQNDLKVDIKNFCENLRSALDFLGHDIRETFCANADPKARFYFPIFPTKAEFEAKMNEWYPDLKANVPDLWSFLESIQPYHQSHQWLSSFNKINNENKHSDLVPQTRTETEQVKVSFAGGSVTWTPKNVRFGPGVSIKGVPLDPQTQMPVPHPSQKVERIVWVDFRFDGENFSAIGLLKSALEGVRDIAKAVEKWF